jgi:chromatin remodeling complex protein RSC6
MARTKVTSAIYKYIKENKLQEQPDANGKVDRRTIVPDAKLRKLFGLPEGETIEFKTFQTHVSKLYNAEKESSSSASTSAPAPVVATPAPVAASAKSTGKATRVTKTNA